MAGGCTDKRDIKVGKEQGEGEWGVGRESRESRESRKGGEQGKGEAGDMSNAVRER